MGSGGGGGGDDVWGADGVASDAEFERGMLEREQRRLQSIHRNVRNKATDHWLEKRSVFSLGDRLLHGTGGVA